MYADNTKIWRQLAEYNDYLQLQEDLYYLLDWSLRNKMKFFPLKCVLLTESKKDSYFDSEN